MELNSGLSPSAKQQQNPSSGLKAPLSFLFPAETDVLVSVLSQDVIVVNFVVVLKFPNDRN